MKRIYMTLMKAIPQAKPNSCDAKHESLLDRLRAGRNVKATTGAAVLSTTILLTGCGDNQGENSRNPEAEYAGDNNTPEQQLEASKNNPKVEFSVGILETEVQRKAAIRETSIGVTEAALNYIQESDSADSKNIEDYPQLEGVAAWDEMMANYEGTRDEYLLEEIPTDKSLRERPLVEVFTSKSLSELSDPNTENTTIGVVIHSNAASARSWDNGEVVGVTVQAQNPSAIEDSSAFIQSLRNGETKIVSSGVSIEKLTGSTINDNSKGVSESEASEYKADVMRKELENVIEATERILGKEPRIEGISEDDIAQTEESESSGNSESQKENMSSNTEQSNEFTAEEIDSSPELSPAQVLALQYHYINAGDYEAAYELFAEESQEIVPLDQYRAFFEDVGYYQLTNYSFPSVDVQGDSAVVEVNLTSDTPTGEGQYQRVQQMILEDGEWRVVMRDEQIDTFTKTG